MATRATIVINQISEFSSSKNPQGEIYVRLSASCDGYPQGIGLDIYNILSPKNMVCGTIEGKDNCNGASDLVVQFISELKELHPVGMIDMLPANANYLYEYNYRLNFVRHKLEEGGWTDKLHSIVVRRDTGEVDFVSDHSDPSLIWEDFYEFCRP